MSGANPGMLEKAKKTLTSTLIGLLIVLCSYLLIYTFVKALNITGIGGFGTSACSVDGAAAPTDSTSVPVGGNSNPTTASCTKCGGDCNFNSCGSGYNCSAVVGQSTGYSCMPVDNQFGGGGANF
jgi:hypothetical protein